MNNGYYHWGDGSYVHFGWERLERDSEESCKGRFRKLINDNSFLNEQLVDKVGDLENAIDLLYQINYAGPPRDDPDHPEPEAEHHRGLIRSIIETLTDHKINHPQCILVDPKLLGSLLICYGLNEQELGEAEMSLHLCQLLRRDGVGPHLGRFDGFSSFVVENSELGLRALWLWQCQLLALSWLSDRSVAAEIELMYNYLRLVSLSRDPNTSRVEKFFISLPEYRESSAKLSVAHLEKWRQVLCGFQCVVASKLQSTISSRIYRNWHLLEEFERQYQLHQPRDFIQLSPDDINEFDAAFVCSGPFKFEITDDILSHLKFKPGDPETILLYFDSQPRPGDRALIFKDNHLADREFKLDLWQREVSLSYSLLFGQSTAGLKVAQKLFRVAVEFWDDFTRLRAGSEILVDRSARPKTIFITQWQHNCSFLFASDLGKRNHTAQSFPDAFSILEPRLANIKDSMRRWRPRRKRDLFKPGYSDRFTYYTQLFALFIAIVGTLGVILSIVQTAYAVLVANDDSIKTEIAAMSEKLDVQLGALLNVSQEILVALQALRPNGTA